MERRSLASFVLPLAALSVVVGGSVWMAEGAAGFRPFANLEALLMVVAGAGACLGAAYPGREVWDAVAAGAAGRPAADEAEAGRRDAILRYGADSAMSMGGVATLLGIILMLSSIEDVSAVPRRMALSLAAGFYGLLLSEAFFMPLARRVRYAPPGHRLVLVDRGARRFLVALGVLGGSLLQFFVILYALSACLNIDDHLRRCPESSCVQDSDAFSAPPSVPRGRGPGRPGRPSSGPGTPATR